MSATAVILIVVAVAVLNDTFLVASAPNGPEWYHLLVPQSMTPVGYWPLSAWFWPARRPRPSCRDTRR